MPQKLHCVSRAVFLSLTVQMSLLGAAVTLAADFSLDMDMSSSTH